jgi:beta-xylosidase
VAGVTAAAAVLALVLGWVPAAAAGPRQVPTLSAVSLPAPGLVLTRNRNVPDPYVVHQAGRYYMFSSQAAFFGAHIPVRVSSSLTHWGTKTVDVLPNLPPWAGNGFTWSPDVRRVRGRYVLWYNALLASSGPAELKCIGVATSRRLLGPYRPVGTTPAICQLQDWGSIDPRTFVAPDGSRWMLWKSDNNADPTVPPDTTIWVERLAGNGISLLGQPQPLITANQPWDGGIVEAPDMVYAAGHYWLFYSANWFNQPAYDVSVDRCAGPTGPCQPALEGPWFGSNAEGAGPGEESLFGQGSRWWMLYAIRHADFDGGGVRPVGLARLVFDAAGPHVVPPAIMHWSPPLDPLVRCASRPAGAACLAWNQRLQG